MNTPITRTVTRKDVARLAGTSVAVVSYVVNNGPRRVSAATANKVLAAIRESGYSPNRVARALAAGTTGTFGLVIPDISNTFFAELSHAIEDEIFAQNRVLLLGDSAENSDREREILNNFVQQRVDGLLYIGVDNHGGLGAVVNAGIPVVVLDRIAEDSPAASVVVDNEGGAKAATRHLIDHGYQDIGFIAGPEGLSVSDDRRLGWKSAMEEACLEIRAEWQFEAPLSRPGGHQAGTEFLAGATRPRALFAANDQQAIGLLGTLYRANVGVPNDVALISFDGTDDAVYSIPPLSTVDQPIKEIARHAVGLLHQPEAYLSNRVICPFSLTLRQSCGCPPNNSTSASSGNPIT